MDHGARLTAASLWSATAPPPPDAPTLAEPGVKLFLPYRSPSDPSQFFVFELYTKEEGWAAHQATPHFKAAIEELLPRVSRRERIPFVPYASL